MRFITLMVCFAVLCEAQCYAQDIGLDTYTCQQFLADTKEPSNGERLLKSMMMISWATGFAAAFQQSNARADMTAIRLVAATLGSECQKNPQLRVVEVISDQIKQLADSAAQNSDGILSLPPVSVSTGEFKTYDNFDLPKGDTRTLRGVELSKCEALCKADGACQAFSYDKWNKWCFLKSKATELTLDPSSISGVRQSLADPQQSKSALRIEPLDAKTVRGHALQSESWHSAQDCKKACALDRTCLGFTYIPSGQDCRMFNRIETVDRENGATSGYKTQSR
jgi:PAN domain/HdeA/HdeB family